MSAPVTEHARATARAATRTAPIPAQRGVPTTAPRRGDGAPAPQRSTGTSSQKSARKAYARRDDRLRRLVGGRPARTAAPAGRAQFVLLIMVLLVVGLVATLWLSTAAAADSYRLQDARGEARTLTEQSERLHREVAAMASAPELARRASELGMIPVQDPARLVVAPDGRVTVVGKPLAAAPPAPAPAPAGAPVPPVAAGQPAPDPAAGAAQNGTAPADQAPADQAPADQAPADQAPADQAAGQAATGQAVSDPATTDQAAGAAAPAVPAGTATGTGTG